MPWISPPSRFLGAKGATRPRPVPGEFRLVSAGARRRDREFLRDPGPPVTAGYSDVPVVRGVDLTVGEGQLVAVVGPNGAGKSTLLTVILGLARVMGGRVLADGRDITGRPLDQLARLGIGYVPQADDVFDPLKVSENLNMGGYLLGKADRIARMEEVLAIFPALRSKLNRYVRTMSGGERKMTAIARALMLSPRVLVLDEPTAGLSAVLTESVLADQVRAPLTGGTRSC